MENMPRGMTPHRVTGGALAGEEPCVAANRAAESEPFLQGHRGLRVQRDQGSLALALGRFTPKVDPREDGVAIMDLSDTQRQKFRNPHAGPHP